MDLPFHVTSVQRFERLCRAQRDLRIDITALYYCLENTGLVHPHDFHRMRFETVRMRAGLTGSHFLEVLGALQVCELLWFCGGVACERLSRCSRRTAAFLGGQHLRSRQLESGSSRDLHLRPMPQAPSHARVVPVDPEPEDVGLQSDLRKVVAVAEVRARQQSSSDSSDSRASRCSRASGPSRARPSDKDPRLPLASTVSPSKRSDGEGDGRRASSATPPLDGRSPASSSSRGQCPPRMAGSPSSGLGGSEGQERTFHRPPKLCICGGADLFLSVPMDLGGGFGAEAGGWELLPPTEHTRNGSAGALLGGSLYVCGGDKRRTFRSKVERYDPVRRRWESLHPMNSNRVQAAVVALAGRLYVCGGEDGLRNVVQNTVERFDPITGHGRGRWETLPGAMSFRRRSFAVAALHPEGKLVACGGCASPTLMRHINSLPERTAEVFEPGGGQAWQRLPSMLENRAFHAAAGLRNCVIACGGSSAADGRGLATCERFEMQTQVWSTLPPMQIARGEPTALALEGCLYVLGGWHVHRGQREEVFNDDRHWKEDAQCTVERFDWEGQCWELMDRE